MKASILTATAILGVSMSAAHAGGPVGLTDSQMDGVTAGIGFFSDTAVNKLVNIQELIQEQKFAQFFVETFVQGHSAVAEAEADCTAANCDSQTFTFAEVYPGDAFDATGWLSTASLSKSIALAGEPGTPTGFPSGE